MIPIISYDELRANILWVSNYWDWPLSGIAMYENRRVFFNCTDMWWEDGESLDIRIFTLYDLPAKLWVEVDARYESFCKHVGTHWNYEDGERVGEVRPQSEWHKHYDVWKPKPSIEQQLKSGWAVAIADSSLDE